MAWPSTKRGLALGAGSCLWCFAVLTDVSATAATEASAPGTDALTGPQIMDEVFRRHEQYPYTYEEQTMVLLDGAGNRDVRKLRRYSRVDSDGTVRFLLVFDNPPEIRGTALLASRASDGSGSSGVYLPAYGATLKSRAGEGRGGHFLGTDFAVEDLTAELLSEFSYRRMADHVLDEIPYFMVEAVPADTTVERATGYSLRRHYIRQDNFYITRTEYFDRRGRFAKVETHHDLKNVNADAWRANMVLMENLKEDHKTLLKIDRRVFSHDYVTPEMFTEAWLFANRHVEATERHLFRQAGGVSGVASDQAPGD